MRRMLTVALALGLSGAAGAKAQDLAARVRAVGDGAAQFRYTTRPGVCGDGESFYRDRGGRGSYVGTSNGRRDWDRDCEPGPARLVLSLAGGRVTRIRMYVGGDQPAGSARDFGRVSTGEAAAFLQSLIEGEDGSVAGEAINALMIADSVAPAPLLLRVARDSARSRRVRQPAMFWLGQIAAERLGLADVDETRSDDDDVRAQAVFALSQQPRERSVPQLLTIARESRNKVARRQALFWLSQSGDPRAVELFAEVLK